MSNTTLAQLRKYQITENSEKSLDYFFYTNKIEKARALAKALEQTGYPHVKYGLSGAAQSEFLINGWSNGIRISAKNVSEWTRRMCELGYKYDCEFDGWGTTTK